VRYWVQAWRYGPPWPSVYGAAGAEDTPQAAVARAARLFGLDEGGFDEPFLPLPMDDLAADACSRGRNLVVVYDDDGYVVAHAELPSDLVGWPSST
jgi:hypothetical protein